ncbi:hypothetical protein KQH65_03375 [archaeon]|nr:hypothetical protein [archaeon]
MIELFESLMRILNGLITLSFFPLLYNLYKRTNRRFFLYWGLGFLLYGINIMLRVVATDITVSYLTMIAFFLTTTGFILIVTGIGELIQRTKYLLTLTLILPIILLVTAVLGGDWQYFIWFIVLSPYAFIVLSLIGIQRYYNYDVKLLLAGWANIFLLNFAFAFNYMNPGFVDLLSAVSKIIIYWGMTQPSFAFIVDDLGRFMISGIATEYHLPTNGEFSLVNLAGHTREKEVTWIKNRIEANSQKGIRTIFISYYDLITPRDLSLTEDNEDTYFVRVQTGTKNMPSPFEEKVMSIGDDLSQLDLLFSDIVKLSSERQIGSEIIIYSLSTVIHTHGWKRLYTFLTAKIPLIKSSIVSLTCFYYPETHETGADISKFEMMADKIIN